MVKEMLGDKLRREARERKVAADRKRREEESVKLKAQRDRAETLWNEEVLPTLTKDIKKAAKKGDTSITIPDLVYMNALNWAHENGMHVHAASDNDDPEWPMHFPPLICWADHPPLNREVW